MATLFFPTETIAATVATVAAFALGRRTTRAIAAATGDQVDIVDLELAGNYKAFALLLEPLGNLSIAKLLTAHYWDSGFAVAYSVAVCCVLHLLALYLPQPASDAVRLFGWAGLAAGAFDLLENVCLMKRFATFQRERAKGPDIRPTDGVLRTAALAATLKFALLALAIDGFLWGLLQGLAALIHGVLPA